MGLDLCFNEKWARDAGMVFSKDTNGDAVDIAFAQALIDGGEATPQNIEHLDWLQKEEDILHVPHTDITTLCYIDEGSVQVRANKWGRMYAPIVDFLHNNEITWSEY